MPAAKQLFKLEERKSALQKLLKIIDCNKENALEAGPKDV